MSKSLEFYTNRQLIKELFSRKTFVGILVASKDEHKVKSQTHDNLEVFSSLSNKQIIQLLEKVTAEMKA